LDANTCIIAQQLQRAGLTDSQISHGLRLPGIWDQYEAGCRAILGQQVSVKAAIGVLNTLVEQLGYKKDSLIFFPEPDAVANSDLAFLRMPQSRKQALRDFSHLYAAKANPTAQDWLAIKGIGPWTADYIKMRGMSEPDVGLSKDLIIKQQLQAHPDIDPDKARPCRSYLNLQLWNNA
jgi:AraC family transcriptional regulator of adaptative response / DNA-3-methyladenine glycosylase II